MGQFGRVEDIRLQENIRKALTKSPTDTYQDYKKLTMSSPWIDLGEFKNNLVSVHQFVIISDFWCAISASSPLKKGVLISMDFLVK